jgi:hypothetical protein
MQTKPPSPRSERGQSLVELALTFSLIMLLLAGTIDLGRAFFTYNALRDAAQEGASYGSLEPTDNTGIEDRVYDNLDEVIADPRADVDVIINIISNPCLGNIIEVNVNYPQFPLTTPFLGTIIGTDFLPIHATIQDTILRPTCGG